MTVFFALDSEAKKNCSSLLSLLSLSYLSYLSLCAVHCTAMTVFFCFGFRSKKNTVGLVFSAMLMLRNIKGKGNGKITRDWSGYIVKNYNKIFLINSINKGKRQRND
jgi:hypothetical protein